MIIQLVQEGGHFLLCSIVQLGKILGEVTDFGGADVPAHGFETFGDVIQILDFRDEPGSLLAFLHFVGFEGFDLLGAGFNRVGLGIAVSVRMIPFDNPHMVKKEGNAAWLAQGAALENPPDVGGGAVAVIGEALNDQRHFVRGESFISDQLVGDFFLGEAGAFFDCAFDRIAGDRGLSGLFDRGGEAGIQIDFRAAGLRGHHDFTDEFDDHLPALLRVLLTASLFPLGSHKVRNNYADARPRFNGNPL